LDFDLDKTLYFFTGGRHEYFNKGVNLFIDALAQLNESLHQSGSDITIVAFIIMPAPTNNFNVESLKGHSIIRDLKETCQGLVEQLANQVFEDALRGDIPAQLIVPKEAEVCSALP
jgi:glycogen synthase